jgi:DNA-binding XRE family transcriptional regulator
MALHGASSPDTTQPDTAVPAEGPPEVRRLREALGLTQEAAAEFLAVNRSTIARWEGGRRTPPAYLELLRRELAVRGPVPDYRPGEVPPGKPWTAQEDALLTSFAGTDAALAAVLGRSHCAVRTRRHRLRSQGLLPRKEAAP